MLLGQEPKRTITVYGQAEAELIPHVIWLNVEYSEHEKAKNSEIAEKEKAIKQIIKAYHIPTEDVEVVDLVGSNYNSFGFNSKKVYVNKSYSIKLKDAKTASEIMMKLFETGANRVFIRDLIYTQKD